MSDRSLIVIHAGMPKTGSTAIQGWLRAHPVELARHGFRLVVARPAEGRDRIEVGLHRDGDASSGQVARILRGEDGAAAAEVFARALRRLAELHGRIVISGEALAHLFQTRGATAMARLEELAREHVVRVAYYVRPQHTALEAAWRQWGFRTGLPPSRYLAEYAWPLHHHDTLARVSSSAPAIDFCVRPFRRDLLLGGDVVKDFAGHVLGMDPSLVAGETAGNVGTPLTVANLLAGFPQGVLWDSPHDNRRFRRLKRLLAEEEEGHAGRLPPALARILRADEENARRGRMLLQRWAHREFADDNRALLGRMGWRVTDWLPDPGDGPHDLALLDDLWSSSASPAELAALQPLLEEATRPGPRRGPGRAIARH